MKQNNQVRIAFTGPWNTGKSTIIKKLEEDLSKSVNDNQWCDPKKVSIYPETARQVLDLIAWGDFDMSDFQKKISKLEDNRLLEIEQDTADILLIDRTCMDWLVYSIFNVWEWYPIRMNQDSKWDYDLVILFTEEFKKTQTEEFSHYNDDRLVDLFRNIMRFLYWDKVVEFKNWWDIKDIKKVIYNLINK